jgi:hypothetical protein
MSSRLCWMIAAAALGLAGCNTTHTHIGDEDAAFGESVKYDLAIQTINPEPVYPPGAARPGASGVKGQGAVKRYRTDTVKPIEATQTTSGSR